MKRIVVACAMLAAITLAIGSIDMPVKVAGLSGDVFAQEVITRKEVTISKTVPPGPSDEEVITRRETVTQETMLPTPPRRVAREILVTQPPPPPRQEVIITAPSPQHVWVSGYWTWNNGWQWVPGHWEMPPQRLAQRPSVWVPGKWVQSGPNWIWRPGHWE